MTNITKVGISLAVFRVEPNTYNKQVLMGKRKGSHGAGEWSFPGGHLDYMEGFIETALRELVEEVGEQFKVSDPEFVSLINMTEYAPKHYVDIGIIAWHISGEPVVMEPDKCEGWEWFDVKNLPSPRFATIDKIMSAASDQYRSDVFVFDKE